MKVKFEITKQEIKKCIALLKVIGFLTLVMMVQIGVGWGLIYLNIISGNLISYILGGLVVTSFIFGRRVEGIYPNKLG
jgi:hypothetical protein